MPSAEQALTKTVQLRFPAFSGGGRDIAFLACADDFDPRMPFTIVLFFHGFDRSLDQQVAIHALAHQVVQSDRNCILICPRTAIKRATESNPGLFDDPNQFSGFLGELPGHIKALVGDETLDMAGLAARTATARVIIGAFSAGHRVASTVMSHPKVRDRLAALAFFDSLYESDAYFDKPQLVLKAGALVGVHRASYDKGKEERNNHQHLRDTLVGLQVQPLTSIGSAKRLVPGMAILESVNIDDHWYIVSHACRLAQVLARVEESSDQPVTTS